METIEKNNSCVFFLLKKMQNIIIWEQIETKSFSRYSWETTTQK